MSNSAGTTQLFRQAKERHQVGQLDDAERLYYQVLEQEPNNAEARHLLGALLLIRYGNSRAEDAHALLKQAIVLQPGEAKYRHSLGKLLVARQGWQQAIDAFNFAIEKDPFNTTYRMSLVMPLMRMKRFTRAFEVCKGVLALEPRHPQANYKAASALRQLRREEEALLYYRRHLQTCPNDEQARFWVAILTQEPVDTAPAAHVSSLFDFYADTFEEHLVKALKYETPQTLMNTLLEVKGIRSPRAQPTPLWQHVVDLGCGTGLFGPLVRPFVAEQLVGIDLSTKMIEKARLKSGIYDRLEVSDIVGALTRHANDASCPRYNLLVAADVFVYIGDLKPVFLAAYAASAPGAEMACSTEHATDEATAGREYMATMTGRFVHRTKYVQTVAAEAGWQFRRCTQCTIRCNAGRPITGDIFVFVRD